MKAFCWIVLLTFFTTHNITAQHEILDDFNAKQNGDAVVLQLIISGGRSCNGIDIYRGIDSSNVNLIGRIPGICGGSDNPVPYEFTDEKPIKNKLVYYRANLGQQGFTDAIPFTFLAFNNDVLLYPNPSTESFALNINLVNTEALITIYNGQGNQVLQFSTNTRQNQVDISDLPVGIYYAIVLLNGKNIAISFIKK